MTTHASTILVDQAPQPLMQCSMKMILGTVISTGALVGKNGDLQN